MGSEEYRSGSDVRTGFVRGNTFGYRPVQYAVIDGQAIFEGDIVLGSVDEMEQLVSDVRKGVGEAEGVVITGIFTTGEEFRWPGGVVPFIIDPDLPDVARVEQAIAHWHDRTLIKFVPHTNEQNFVIFRPGDGCSARVGMRGGLLGQQFITLGPGCDRASTIHEIGHAVGLWHEQSREDRDLFIRVLWENIEPGMEHNFTQHIVDGDDVGRYDFRSLMHYSPRAFSRNGQPTIETLNGEAIGRRNGLSDGDVEAVRFMYYPPISLPLILQPGLYTIRQKSSGRFVDAHEHSGKDFAVVTRTAQNSDTQTWILKPLGGIYTIQQKSNGRFVDAYDHAGKDFALVTRTAQNNDTQRWIVAPAGKGEFTIQQKSNGRFVDAHGGSADDFAVVTRTAQGDDTQRWVVTPAGNDTYTIQQKSNGRFVDAHEIEGKDFALVTRAAQDDDTQRWILTPVGVVCTLQQRSNGRYVDAHDHASADFGLVTRAAQDDETQKWIVMASGSGTYTIQQRSSGRFVDAHEIEAKDFALVMRTAQNDDTQRWLIKSV